MSRIAKLVALLSVSLVAFAQSQPRNIYAAGLSANPSASPQVAGTGLYARLVEDSGTYLFTVVDALPTTIKPFVVTTQFSGGVAQKVVTIAKIPIYIPTSAGVSYNGQNVGWAWSTGAMGVVALKHNWKLLPNLRMVKSSVSGGTGYQVIAGVMVGWAQ